MTDEELAEWGLKEDEIRKTEMEQVNSQTDLEQVQKACAQRRQIIGLSRSQAAWWVGVGQRLKHGDSLSFAMRKR